MTAKRLPAVGGAVRGRRRARGSFPGTRAAGRARRRSGRRAARAGTGKAAPSAALPADQLVVASAFIVALTAISAAVADVGSLDPLCWRIWDASATPLKRACAWPPGLAAALLAAPRGSRRRSRRLQPRGRGRDEPSPRRGRISAHRQHRSRGARDRRPARGLGQGLDAAAPGGIPRPGTLHRHDARRRDAPDRHDAGAQSRPRRRRARIARRDPQVALGAAARRTASTVLADCVLDANVAMDALFAPRRKSPTGTASRPARESYRATLQRCDGMAPPASATMRNSAA